MDLQSNSAGEMFERSKRFVGRLVRIAENRLESMLVEVPGDSTPARPDLAMPAGRTHKLRTTRSPA
jgi:hypothetical protein